MREIRYDYTNAFEYLYHDSRATVSVMCRLFQTPAAYHGSLLPRRVDGNRA